LYYKFKKRTQETIRNWQAANNEMAQAQKKQAFHPFRRECVKALADSKEMLI